MTNLAGTPARVVVTSPMKCGSTNVANVIARYCGASFPTVEYDWLSENNLTPELLGQLGSGPFAMNLHMLPRTGNLLAGRDQNLQFALLWRNLADTVVSYDDHTRRYGAHNPIFYVDHDAFLALPVQRRYRYIIRGMVSWNLGFYLSWRKLPGLPFHPYEAMVADPFGFFRFLLWQLGIGLDDVRLRAALDYPPERFNIGVIGRSAELLDDDNKRLIEQTILEHAEFDELEVLLWELPWPCCLDRRSAYDGTTVARESDGATFFVSRGVRHLVSSRWIVSRATPALRQPRTVSDAGLAGLNEGGEFI